MAALDHPCNDIVAPETDGPLELQEDLCRCGHRRPSQPTTTRILVHSRLRTPASGSWKVCHWRVVRSVARVPLPAFPISTTATTAPSTDQDIAGIEIGMDHVRCLSWWWDVGTHEPQALHQGRHHGGIPREPGDSRFLTGGGPPGVRPVVVGLGGLASLEFDDLHQLLNDGWGQLWHGSRVNEVHQMPYMSGCDPTPSQAGVG